MLDLVKNLGILLLLLHRALHGFRDDYSASDDDSGAREYSPANEHTARNRLEYAMHTFQGLYLEFGFDSPW